MVLNILDIWACCFRRLLTSETWTPAPRAMRLRRLPLMMEALRRSFAVIESMMVSTRLNCFSLTETILPEWGLVRVWRKAIQSLRLRLRSGLRQRGGVFDAGFFLGLRPRLVYVGPLALGVGVD